MDGAPGTGELHEPQKRGSSRQQPSCACIGSGCLGFVLSHPCHGEAVSWMGHPMIVGSQKQNLPRNVKNVWRRSVNHVTELDNGNAVSWMGHLALELDQPNSGPRSHSCFLLGALMIRLLLWHAHPKRAVYLLIICN